MADNKDNKDAKQQPNKAANSKRTKEVDTALHVIKGKEGQTHERRSLLDRITHHAVP
jgi:hypothetical protein